MRFAAMILSASLLTACGGGGDGASAGVDVDGVWVVDNSAIGGVAGLMLAGGDAVYGYQVEGRTTRYFKGQGPSIDSAGFTYATTRIDEAATGSGTATPLASGKLTGGPVPGSSPTQLFVTFSSSALTTFAPMRMDPAPANVSAVADARDFAGTYALPAGALTITSTAAAQAALSGIGVNGCTVSGTLTLARADRNVWTARLVQSQCATPARNGTTAQGLATMYRSGSSFNVFLLAEDGLAWTLVSSSR